MAVLITVVILSVGFLTGYCMAIAVYDRVTLWEEGLWSMRQS